MSDGAVLSSLAFASGLSRPRTDSVARESTARMEARLDERLRIARELHDTLLQTFQASLIQMQIARNLLFKSPEKAAQDLDHAIKLAADAIGEGQAAIQGLRCDAAHQGDLEESLATTGQELAASQEPKEHPVSFRMVVEGQRRQLNPIIQEEVYQIGRELLRNAFRHARASQIEAEIRYQRRLLCLHVRDDGTGISPEILETGRDGHWGLPGIRERANRIGARLDFWSKTGAGTEVKLTVPASVAYSEPPRIASARGRTE